MRDYDLIERQLAIAIRKGQPRVIARLTTELANTPKPVANEWAAPTTQMADTLDNRAAFKFYN